MKPYYSRGGIEIYHGDCREILPTLYTGSIDLVLTDPPYGIDLDTDYTRFKGNSQSRKWNKVSGDKEEFDPTPWLKFPVTLMFGANYYSDKLPLGKWAIWNKRDEGPSRVLADAEMAWHNGPGKSVRVFNWFWVGCYRKGEMAQPVLHPTQKPIALMQWCIEEMGTTGTILDPYMGSGTTLKAAKNLGRSCIGIEIEEKYCEIAAKRLSQDSFDLESVTPSITYESDDMFETNT